MTNDTLWVVLPFIRFKTNVRHYVLCPICDRGFPLSPYSKISRIRPNTRKGSEVECARALVDLTKAYSKGVIDGTEYQTRAEANPLWVKYADQPPVVPEGFLPELGDSLIGRDGRKYVWVGDRDQWELL